MMMADWEDTLFMSLSLQRHCLPRSEIVLSPPRRDPFSRLRLRRLCLLVLLVFFLVGWALVVFFFFFLL